MMYRDSDNMKLREVKDILDFPTSFLAHLEILWKKRIIVVKAYGVEDGGTFKKFSHKKDITQDLYYNIYCGNVVEMIHIFCQQRNTYYWLLTYHTDFIWLDQHMMMNHLCSNNLRNGERFHTENILMVNCHIP